jgi:hypothetical protein
MASHWIILRSSLIVGATGDRAGSGIVTGIVISRPVARASLSSDVATVETVADQDNDSSADRRSALVLSGLLLVAGVLIGLSPLIGVATAGDGSPTTASVAAAFVAVLPGVVAMVLAAGRSALGLAATAGAGAIGLIRVFADLAVITETDGVTRPELFVETTDRARPFAVGTGAWLLLAADLLMLVVGVLAASRLGAIVLSTAEPGPDALFGAPAPSEAGSTPDSADESDGTLDPSAPVAALSGPPTGRLAMNLPLLSAGFLGAVLLMVAALEIPYTGGYLALRVLPLGSSLTGVVAAVLIVLVIAVIVVIAASLPRQIARALLAGTAAAAAVPSLTAVVAVLTGAPTGLSSAVWWGLAGAIILAAAGQLARGGPGRTATADATGEPPQSWLTIGTGVAALLAAASLAAASQTALLNIDGSAPDELFGAVLQPAGPPLLIAAIPIGIAGLAALIHSVAQIGRACVAVVWAGAVYALGQVLWVRSRVLDSVRNPLNVDLPAELQHNWSTGPGLWLSVLGTLLAVAVAVLAVITGRRTEQASPEIVDDSSLAGSRSARWWPAVALTVLVVVALALPVYGYLGRSASSTLVLGYELDTWGVWAIALAACGGVWAAALTRRPPLAAALLVSAACVVVQPLIVPAVIRAEPGFAFGPGFWAGIVAVVALLVAAGYFAVVSGRVRIDDRAPLAEVLEADQTGPVPPPRSPADSKGR